MKGKTFVMAFFVAVTVVAGVPATALPFDRHNSISKACDLTPPCWTAEIGVEEGYGYKSIGYETWEPFRVHPAVTGGFERETLNSSFSLGLSYSPLNKADTHSDSYGAELTYDRRVKKYFYLGGGVKYSYLDGEEYNKDSLSPFVDVSVKTHLLDVYLGAVATEGYSVEEGLPSMRLGAEVKMGEKGRVVFRTEVCSCLFLVRPERDLPGDFLRKPLFWTAVSYKFKIKD